MCVGQLEEPDSAITQLKLTSERHLLPPSAQLCSLQ